MQLYTDTTMSFDFETHWDMLALSISISQGDCGTEGCDALHYAARITVLFWTATLTLNA